MTDVKPNCVSESESEKLQNLRASLRQYSSVITKETPYVELKAMMTKILKSIPLKTSID